MMQPIAGVAPASGREVTIMSVWPSLAAHGWGRWWGRRFQNQLGFTLFGVPVTLGRVLALVSIPFLLPLYFHMLVPRLPFLVAGVQNPACRRYRLTNQRVLVETFGGDVQRSVALDRFDTIAIEVQPGQEWYRAGDLVFRHGQIETFRLPGISHPEGFRHACLKASQGLVGVQKARDMGYAGV